MKVGILLFIAFVGVICEYEEAPYAEWAHSHVVWINGKHQNQKLIIKLVEDYQASYYLLI